MIRPTPQFSVLIVASLLTVALLNVQALPQDPASPRAVFDKYCVACHNEKNRVAGLDLASLDALKLSTNAETVEKVIAKLRAGSMPPPGSPRPDAETYKKLAVQLEQEMDRAWETRPNPGRIGSVHRLNRAEYNNAIRDLFAINLDVKPLLPGDDTADGSFDNFADSLSISTAHLERYMSIARQVTRLATGLPPVNPTVDTYEIPLHVIQEERQSEDLPFGSRGGIAVTHEFPVAGDYTIRVRLQRQYQDYIKGMGWPQQLDVRLDGKLLKRFEVGGKAVGRPAAASYAGDGEPYFAGDDSWEKYMQIEGDAGLQITVPVTAGPHVVGVSFLRELFEPEGLPQPLQRGRVITNDQVYMGYANVGQIQVGGPYKKDDSKPKDTPSRRAIFVCEPKAGASNAEVRACANKIVSKIARLAYRRPVTDPDVLTLMEFFDRGRTEGKSFEGGIQFALERMLVDPDFLMRVIHEPSNRVPGRPYPLSNIELASRLSFFLWSSIPDDSLLTLAERGQLTNPQTLEKEVRRMMADPRAATALTENFAAQWLNLRRVPEVVVDPIVYPNYDLSLLQGFQQETEMFVAHTIREDRPLAELINANYTFVNERLARQYGIPGIYGSRFRRINLPDSSQRGGLLAQGALLATTSYPERTSPVLRGKWFLNNIMGQPITPPPPGVDTNIDNKPGAALKSIRERLAQHRNNPSCNACHASIDPLGFALENFDVIGGWRNTDESGQKVDASGVTVTGKKVDGLPGLRSLLLDDPQQFPRTVTEKLMAYALGRKLEYYDLPTIRRVVREAAAQDYRWSAIVLGIVKSPNFLTRNN
jgi:mono/diheme cytochrome c family protein